MLVGESTIQGLGAFAGESIKDGELISEYVGEIINEVEAERRGRVYDEYGSSYLFNLDREHAVDAYKVGSPIRFANHSSKTPNCYAKIVNFNGEYRIGIYAKGNIAFGQELLFDYGYREDYKRFITK